MYRVELAVTESYECLKLPQVKCSDLPVFEVRCAPGYRLLGGGGGGNLSLFLTYSLAKTKMLIMTG